MDNFRAMKVEALKTKCREFGLRITGKKKDLIKRLEEYYEEQEIYMSTHQNQSFSHEPEAEINSHHSIIQSNFVPHQSVPLSSTLNTMNFFPSTNPFLEMSSVTTENNILPLQSSVPLQHTIAANHQNTANIIHGTTAAAQICSNNTVQNVNDQIDMSISSFQQQPIVSAASNQAFVSSRADNVRPNGMLNPFTQQNQCQPMNLFPQNIQPFRVSNQNYASIPAAAPRFTYFEQQYQQMPATYVYPNNQPVPFQFVNPYNPVHYYPSTSPSSDHNQFNRVADVISILPEFDPLSSTSPSTAQYVQKIESLKSAYNWDDKVLIFAIQSKMKGPAKLWMDSIQNVFVSWNQFKEQLMHDFPCDFNIADIHIEMLDTKRKLSETPEEYFYKMLALGRKGGLPDECIIKYTINGINHDDLRKAISKSFTNCNELLSSIKGYISYNPIKYNPHLQMKSSNLSFTPKIFNPRFQHPSPSYTQNIPDSKLNENKAQQVICYNCFKSGHLSIRCPEPPRRQRCEICFRTKHSTEECPEKNLQNIDRKPNINKVDGNSPGTEKPVTMHIHVNGLSTLAFVDPGSNKTLVRKSFAANLNPKFNCNIKLTGFAGGCFECTEYVSVSLEVDNNIFTADVLIVSDEYINENVLLGRDVLCQEGNRLIIETDNCRIEKLSIGEGNIGISLLEPEKNQLKQLISSYHDIFATTVSELGKCTIVKMDIKVKSDVPINSKPYRVPFAKRSKVKEIVDELLENNIIRPSESMYASPIVLVEKKNGESRMCVDYRMLNKITIKQPFPMPSIDDQLAQLAGNKYFTVLDLKMGYHQIEISEESKKYTAFITTDGHFEYNRMPFGLVDAPAVFQSMMNKLISKMQTGEVIGYLDDITIPSKTVKEGLFRLQKFFKILKEAGLTLRLDKCKFLSTEITYLGHEISEHGISPGETKVSAVKNFTTPTTLTEVRRFLGLTGFFRKFICNYSSISKPLTNLLRNNESFDWGAEQDKAVKELTDILCSRPCLALYDISANHEVHTDASSIGLAGVLLQSQNEINWQPVMYYSRHCSDIESKYHSYELEVLAVVETLERFRVYLLGKHFRIVTDCSAITHIKNKTEMIPRIARWWMKLQEYSFDTIHRSGDRMSHVDALSRAPDQPPKEVEPAGFVMSINLDQYDWLATMQIQDKELLEIIAVLKNELNTDRKKQIKNEYQIKNNRLYYKNQGELKFVVPKAVRFRVVQHFHDDMGHFGLEKTIDRINQKFWFPRIRRYVKSYIAACIRCCYMKSKCGKPEGRLHFDEMEPIPFRLIHIDHLGPFVRSSRGNSYVVAISDAFSKFIIVKAVRNTKVNPVINIMNELTSYFGLPKRVVTDRGTAFTAKAFEEYCEKNSIQHIKTAVRTPRANGQVERANQNILSFLRTTINDPRKWDEILRDLQFSLNSMKNTTTNFCANEIVFDFKLIDVVHNEMVAALSENESELPEMDIKRKRELVLENITKEREKWKIRFDQRHADSKKYNENDLVVIEYEAPSTGESRKLEPKYRGPYMIAKVLGNDRYIVEDIAGMQVTTRKFSSTYASDKIKPWCTSEPDLDGIEIDYDDDGNRDDSISGEAELSQTH